MLSKKISKILVVGHIPPMNASTSALLEKLAHEGNKVVVINSDESKDISEKDLSEIRKLKDTVIKYEASPMLKSMHEGKQFICKGKHKYEDVNGKWICQCGRTL